ncbi:ATP-dependent RNA helicase TDRD9 isoform X2 [Stigmatopora argus]
MKKTFTAEQISNWFVSGPTFATIKLTEEVVDKTLSDPLSERTSPLNAPDEENQKSVKIKDHRPTLGSPPPPLESSKTPNLPITKNRQELISFIENNSVVIVRGGTGSGKTTQLPQYILDHYNDKHAPCNIVVTQPRKLGATSIARWVATQRNCTCGTLVGYQVGLEKKATEDTRLIYVTTGVLLEKLVFAKTLTEFSHIFIDEVHERNEEMDFLLLVVRKLLNTNSRYVKVILMSATINCRQFSEYFSTLVQGKMSPAYIFEVEGTLYGIEDFYLDDLKDLSPYYLDSASLDNACIRAPTYALAISLIESFDRMEIKNISDAEKDGGVSFSERGSVLVFLPGICEIICMQQALAKLVNRRLHVYALHSTITLEEQYGVFLPPVPGYRKVILSTNIAESSVTVPDVKYVIDFCLTRQLICDKETNYQFLSLSWAAKTNCNQRRGRAGRVSKGYCYRLVSKDFWEKQIPDYMIPEMLLAPLSTIMLKVKLLDMGDARSLLSTAPSPPDLKKIARTVLELKEIGALSAKQDGQSNEDGELTFLGRVLAQLPVDLYLGKMIVLGHVFGCLDECLILAACNSMTSFFAMPLMQQLAGHRSKMAFAQGSQSDSIAFINTFKAWLRAKKLGQLRNKKDERAWGKENFIQIKRIQEVAALYEDLKKRVEQFNMFVPENTTKHKDYTSTHTQKFILQVVIAGAYYPNYFVQGEIDEHLASRELNGFNPRTSVMLRNLPPFSFLYYKQLQSLFRQCGQVKTICFEHSRAYVEFYRTSHESSTLPEVSLALLLAQQNPDLELSVYPIEQIEMGAGKRPITHLKYARVNVDLQSDSVFPVGVLSSTLDPDKLPPNNLFMVNVTLVVDVGHFWGFPADEVSMQKQRQLTGEINSRTLQPLTMSLYPNLFCLAPNSNKQGLYYRAKILHIHEKTVEVFFLDLGNIDVVQCDDLRELPSELQSQAFQAQEFQVVEMRPSPKSIITGRQWSSRAHHRFTTLVKDQSVRVSLYSILHRVMRVQLFVSTEKTDKSLVDIFVEEGHAVHVEESFDSKENHEMLLSLYQDIKTGLYVPNAASSSWKNCEEEKKEAIDHLLAHFFERRIPYSRTKVRLYGPSSPYKIQFHPFHHNMQGRYPHYSERHLPYAGHPWTACHCYHALHPHHGITH